MNESSQVIKSRAGHHQSVNSIHNPTHSVLNDMNQCQCTTLHCMSYRLYVCVQPSSTAKVPCAAWRSHRNHRYASPLRKFDVWESIRASESETLSLTVGWTVSSAGCSFQFFNKPGERFAVKICDFPCDFTVCFQNFYRKIVAGISQQGKFWIFSAKLSLGFQTRETQYFCRKTVAGNFLTPPQ